jgi:prepilin-type N-terminal cleavage/methylation domain-containing protein
VDGGVPSGPFSRVCDWSFFRLFATIGAPGKRTAEGIGRAGGRGTRRGANMAVSKRTGFTLAELLVVITIIGVLIGLLLPAVMSVRQSAQRTTCSNRQNNIGKALIMYEQAKQSYPAYADTLGRINLNWAVRVLPNLGREDLWAEWRTASQTGTRNLTTMAADLSMYRCPTDMPTETYPLSYAVNCGLPSGRDSSAPSVDWAANGLFHNRITMSDPIGETTLAATNHVFASTSDIKDGAQYTILLSENIQTTEWISLVNNSVPYANTRELRIGLIWFGQPAIPGLTRLRINEEKTTASTNYAHARPSANHGNVVMVTFCDGSQRPIRENIEYSVYAQLMSPDGQNIMQTRSKIDVTGTPAVPKTSAYSEWYRPLSERDFQ